MSRRFSGFILIAAFVFAMPSCQKNQNAEFASGSNLSSVSANSTNVNDPLQFPLCSSIPDDLKVPEGNKLFLQTFARGVQIYQVQRSASDPNVFQWVNIAPSATLYARPDFVNELIIHSAGPTWEFIKGTEKGEKVVATKVAGVTPDQTAIQWLLLKADSTRSTPDNKVTFIQRICTVEGLAPTTGADEAHLGQLDSIPYKASYLFYEKE